MEKCCRQNDILFVQASMYYQERIFTLFNLLNSLGGFSGIN